MSRIFSTGRDENLENAVGQPLIDLEKVAAKLSGSRMVRTASNKQTKKAGVEERQQIQEAVSRILQKKQEEDACMGDGTYSADGVEMAPSAGKVSVRPRETKASINSFGLKKGGFIMPTAEYLEKCAAEGDEESYLKALEIRTQFINAFAKKQEIEEARRVEAAKEARELWRSVIAENLDDDEDEDDKKDDEDKDEDDGIPEFLRKKFEKGKKKKKDKKASVNRPAFKTASTIEEKEREILASKLVSLGYSRDTAMAYISDALTPRYHVPEHIEKLSSAQMDKEAKTAIFKGFVREAKLEEKDRSHLLDYWTNVLGYQDKEWCSDLVKDVDPVTGD